MLISCYFMDMLDLLMLWDDVVVMVWEWNGQFCLKGVMLVDDVCWVVDIGCIGIVLLNYGGW